MIHEWYIQKLNGFSRSNTVDRYQYVMRSVGMPYTRVRLDAVGMMLTDGHFMMNPTYKLAIL